MLTADQLDVIKQTVPVLKEHGETLTRHFYQRMFRENPEVQTFFNPAHQRAGTQQRALAAAVCAYAENIGNPAVLAGAVELIAHKHASLGIKAEHYPIVGANLLGAIQEVLGDAATPAIIEAWAAAYGVLADIFIQREAQLYRQQEEQHGWQGFKRFVVARREPASSNIVSVYLQPEDGVPLQRHQAGQYITVRVTPGEGQPVMRNYSLSNRPGTDYYRISVKREEALQPGAPHGVCSGYVHDHLKVGDIVEVAPPCGEFTLQSCADPAVPLVLIAGGVGITPIISMLYAALAQLAGREIIFIQCALNGDVRAFAGELDTLASDYQNLTLHVRLSAPTEADRVQGRHDSEGLLDDDLLTALLGNRRAEFYFCGPVPMLQHTYRLLKARGVADADIHYEFFGPAESLAA